MPRGWMDNPVFGSVKRAPFSRRDAWAWLVENAAYQPVTVRFNGREIDLERGQIAVSLLHLGGAWGWDTMKVSRFISAIVSASMAEALADKARTLITICNYEQFSATGYLTEIPRKSHRDTHRAATETGSKEDKPSPNGEGTTNARATRLPRDFEMPLDWIEDGAAARVKAHLPPVDLATEAVKFVNHWLSKAGQAGTKLDWHRTWINWCLSTKGLAHGSRPRDASDGHARALDILAQAALDADEPEGYRRASQAPH
jgi:hypothetical protein